MDRSFWRKLIEENHYELPDPALLMPYTLELFGYLGERDSELRDTFGANILGRWIVKQRYHSGDQVRDLMDECYRTLGIGLGEEAGEHILKRSNSIMILSWIAYRDTRERFLDDLEVQLLLDKAQTYLQAELDLRPYLPELGWTNTVANVSDLLRFLAHNSALSPADLQMVLHALADKLLLANPPLFAYNEEERFAKVALAVMLRDGLSSYELGDWVRRFKDWHQEHPLEQPDQTQEWTIYQNSKRFLWSVLVQMRLAPRLTVAVREFEGELLETLRAFSV